MIVWYLTTLTYPSTLANRLQVIKMTEAFSRHADITLWVASIGGKKKEVLESYGVKGDLAIKELPASLGILWPQSFFRALAFRRIVREAPPETVFYTRDVLLAFFLTILSPRFRSKFFFECHSLGKMPSIIYGRVFRSARGIISTNKAKAEVIARTYRIGIERITVAPNGFDASLFDALPPRAEARQKLGFSQDAKIVLYAGSLQPWKGVDIVYELAKLLPDMLFVVLGALAEQKNNNIWKLPAVASYRVPEYLRAASILIAPYRTDSDRARLYFSPIKIMEYLASGTPVVTTDLAAIREIVSEDSLWFAKNVNAKDFRDAILYITSHSDDAQKRSDNARTQSADFSWSRRAERILSFTNA